MTNLDVRPNDVQAYAQGRKEQLPALHRLCDEMGYPIPPRFSQEEKTLLLLTAQYSSRHEAIAREQIDRSLLPVLWEEKVIANVAREGLLREQIRHIAVSTGGAVSSAAVGAVVGLTMGVVEALVRAFEKLAVVFVPGVLSFLAVCIIQTARLEGTPTTEVLDEIVGYAAWVGLLAALVATVAFSAWRAYTVRAAVDVSR